MSLISSMGWKTQRCVVLCVLALSACARVPETLVLSGPTMGTMYTVRWIAEGHTPAAFTLRRDIDAELTRVDTQMSRYRPDSELSRFNESRSTAERAASPEFAQLLSESMALNAVSGGAFDVTVAPLVDAWGFGPRGEVADAPTPHELQQLLERRGGNQLHVELSPPRVRKLRPDVEVDLNAIAPGHAVDRIGALLERRGVRNYLVDIGGEIRVSGHNGNDEPWRIAIDDPRHEEQVPYSAVELSGGAVSTSGGYRHFRILDGQRYSHLIDPRSGYPASLATAAVIVIAPTAAQADGWSTALFVLGEKEGLALAARRHLAVLFLLFDGQGLREHASPAFEPYRAQANTRQQNAS
ncbi:MAG TPA: FAD:protein FMN transferase [Steroidobacteraceae bacterium]|nr:FAD:protein FMN transferase [Steroidobacteraceae bacterium]